MQGYGVCYIQEHVRTCDKVAEGFNLEKFSLLGMNDYRLKRKQTKE
jgi:hypothetical protein